ncbi:GRIP domain-containing protein RUD3-like [Nicotiana sylvestris]|uniref:GRIP domain-containing protein RUD3-like n=1 Tax=Nicotiana sylvestris TaxID=4096 RepID=UPI00388CB80D
MAEDSELWGIICDGPHIPMKKLGETGPMVPKDRKEYSDNDRKSVEKNYRAKKILVCGIGPDEYNRVSACDSAKEIWEALQTAHEGTTQVKQPKIECSPPNVIPKNKLVRKILSVLPGSWESKLNSTTESKDLQTLTMDELIGNLKTYEMKRKKDSERREPKKEKNLALAAWGDSSSELEREPDAKNNSMMEVETEATKYDSLFALMAESDDDENDEVNFRDVQKKLKSYSSNKLRSLTNVLIDTYYSLDSDKAIPTIKLGEDEQSRDDPVVCVIDLNETIANLEKEKEVLNEKLNSVENKRDDLMVVVVDLKEPIEGLSNEKHTLEEKIIATEQERDEFLVIITDLEETIEELNLEHRNVSLGKGKEVASETHIKLEKELIDVKTSLCGELEKNRQLQAELEKGTVRRSDCNGSQTVDTKNTMDCLSLKALQKRESDMMSQMKETREDNATFSSTYQKEHGTSITTTEAEETIGDVVQGKTLLEWPLSMIMSHVLVHKAANSVVPEMAKA